MNKDEAKETASKGIEIAKNIAGKLLEAALSLKKSNPKAFYGGIAVIVIVFLMMGGGKSNKVTGPAFKQLDMGQQYVLKGANVAGEKPVIKLVSAPGSLAAYDDTEESDRTGCKNLPEGTSVKVKRLADAYGKKDTFAEIEILSGECKGRTGWTLSINVR